MNRSLVSQEYRFVPKGNNSVQKATNVCQAAMSLPVPERSSYDLQRQKNQARLYLKEFQGAGVVGDDEGAEGDTRKETNHDVQIRKNCQSVDPGSWGAD